MDIYNLINLNEKNNEKNEKKNIINLENNFIKEKLLPYQISHTINLINNIINLNIVIDASDTGVGKTYTSVAVAKYLNKKALIICPKTLMTIWNNILNKFKVDIYDIVNYETIKLGKRYINNSFIKRIKSNYIEKETKNNDYQYKWNISSKDNIIIILDEVHKCKDINSENGKILLSLIQLLEKKIPIILISATICEKLKDIKNFMILLKIIPSKEDFNKFLKNKEYKYRNIILKDKMNYKSFIAHQEIKKYIVKIDISKINNLLPKNNIICEEFFVENFEKIKNKYEDISVLIEKLRKYPNKNILTKIQKIKQEIELLKIPIFIEQTKIYIEKKKSVIIFVNYLETIKVLKNKLNINCKIIGTQSLEENLSNVKLFQTDKERIIICSNRVASTGISLNDTNGNYPRVSLINIPDSVSTLIQILGRTCRNGTKSNVIQKIIFVSNINIERKIMINIKTKINNINIIKDGNENNINIENFINIKNYND